jgi:hypothetical protein
MYNTKDLKDFENPSLLKKHFSCNFDFLISSTKQKQSENYSFLNNHRNIYSFLLNLDTDDKEIVIENFKIKNNHEKMNENKQCNEKLVYSEIIKNEPLKISTSENRNEHKRKYEQFEDDKIQRNSF